MPFEVVGTFFRCSDLHTKHSHLKTAATCFDKLTQRYNNDIPIHPISQQFIYQIVAIDRKGKQRNYSRPERDRATELGLDPRSFEPDLPTITTFYRIATLYYEALKLTPIITINLDGLLDYKKEFQHFWSTDAGIGQALANAQQAIFTLELSLKAYLEGLGKLGIANVDARRRIQTHDLTELFKLLTEEEKQVLEDSWSKRPGTQVDRYATFQQLLSSYSKQYRKWRYLTDLTKDGASLSIHIPSIIDASEFLLSASLRYFRDKSSYNIQTTISTYSNHESDQDTDGNKPRRRSATTLVEGRVDSLIVPDSYDPYSLVNVVINSHHYDRPITASFYKRDTKNYYGLAATTVSLIGEIREDQPYVLQTPRHLEPPSRVQDYTSEYRTLFGSVYDIRAFSGAFGSPGRVVLLLWDRTYSCQVECLFIADQERNQLKDIALGDKILISGVVTLLHGVPIVLLGPENIEKRTEPGHL